MASQGHKPVSRTVFVDPKSGEQRIQVSEVASDFVQITPLGAGREVGRSCLIVKYKGKTIMVFFFFWLSDLIFYKKRCLELVFSCFILLQFR